MILIKIFLIYFTGLTYKQIIPARNGFRPDLLNNNTSNKEGIK